MLLTKRIHESRVTKVTNTPTAPNYPRHHHPSFAANIRYDFPPPPRFNISHASTPSIHPPLSVSRRRFFHPVSAVSTLLASCALPCTNSHPRSRLFQPTGELVIPRVLARTTETRRFGRARRMPTSSWWPSPSPLSRSSLSGPPWHV